MSTTFPEGKYKRFVYNVPDTAENIFYTCPSTGFLAAYLVWLNCADDAGAARTITLSVRDSVASTTYVLVSAAAIAANLPYQFTATPLVLAPGDTLRATGSAAGIHIVGTVIEVARPNRGV